MPTLSLPTYSQAPALLADAEIAYEEIVRLSSLARALNPALPPHVRFFQRTDADPAGRGQDPGRVVFTHDIRPSLESGLQDSTPVDLFDALGQVLPARLVAALRERLDAATSQPVPGGVAVQAFAAAHKAGRLTLETQPTTDPERVIVASQPIEPAPLAFAGDAFLVEVAASNLKRVRAPQDDESYDFIAAVVNVRQALAADVRHWPQVRLRDTIDTIRSLDGMRGEEPFEVRCEQGWIAYSLLAGGQGWIKPLLTLAPDVVRPHTGYQGVSPIAAAVLSNQPTAVAALLEAGVSPNAFLNDLPPVLGRDQAAVADLAGSFAPLTVVGAAVGATEAVAQLVRGGAMVDLRNGGGQTALAVAADQGNEALMRVLLTSGADPELADGDGVTPRQRLGAAPWPTALPVGPAAPSPSRKPGL